MKICHVTFSVKDMEESLKFYQDILGLPLKRRVPAGPGTELAFLADGETEIELISGKDPQAISIGEDISIGLQVSSVDETAEDLRGKGIEVGPMIQPGPDVKFFFIKDPNGLRVQIVEYIGK